MNERAYDTEEVERMVRLVNRGWEVHEDVVESSGRHHIHRLGIETRTGIRNVILKIPEDRREFSTEARILSVLNNHTELPVPGVVGVVDEHDELPTFFLIEELPGESIHKTETRELKEDTLRKIGVESGRYLSRLHRVDAVDSFGVITPEKNETLSGGVPSGNIDQINVGESDNSWSAHVEDSVEEMLEELSDPRFEDLVPEVREASEYLISGLEREEFNPVIGRVENSLDNLLVDPEDGEVTGMLDWEFVSATTGGNDLVLSEFWLSGGPWNLLASTPDYRELVRDGLVEGYLENERSEDRRVVKEFRSHHDFYELVVYLRTMLLFDEMFDNLGVSGEERETAVENLRNRVNDITNRV